MRNSLMLAILALALATPLAAQQKTPVNFARGTSSIQLAGSIKGYEFRDYVVRAAAGQQIQVVLNTRSPSAYFNLLPPGSTDVASFIGSTEGNRFSGTLDRGGPWTVRVFQMRNVARRGAIANYRLTISVTGRAGRPPVGDALVPGTNFNATSMIRCVAEPNRPMFSCKAGVRRTGGGGGTVHVTMPGGGIRVISFRGGIAIASDSPTGLTVERLGDVSVVRIGAAEVYEIPDAFILGG